MKSFACAALCILVTLQVTAAAHQSEEVKECADEHHIKADDLKNFFDGMEGTKDLKCFMKCVMEHFEMFKEDGTLDMSSVKKHDASLSPVALECSKIDKNDDLCEFAYLHSVCMREKAPEEKWKNVILELFEGTK